MALDDRTALPALWLDAALLALAMARPAPRPAPCPKPREVAALDGRSVAVACRPGGAGAQPLRGPARLLFGLPVDPNRASALTLEALPGIGPVRAQAILGERARRPFASVAELTRVRGIGPKTLRRVAPQLAIVREGG